MAKVTLRMIANEAGCSPATVSMALRGKGKISKTNAARIRQIATNMGYVPNPLIASLASKKFRGSPHPTQIPLALLEFKPHKGDVAPASQYRDALQKYAQIHGYAATLYGENDIAQYQDLSNALYHRGTAGVIITGQPSADLYLKPEKWASLALCQCGRYQEQLPLHTVRANIFQAVKLAFDKALGHGYQRIGFALGRHATPLEDDLARIGAAKALIDELLPPERRVPPFTGAFNDYGGILQWGRQHQVDCYISFNIALWFTLREAGLQCPKDIGYISLQLNSQTKTDVAFCGLDQSLNDIAEQSILQIDQMVRHRETGIPEKPRHTLIQSTWIDGETLRPVP